MTLNYLIFLETQATFAKKWPKQYGFMQGCALGTKITTFFGPRKFSLNFTFNTTSPARQNTPYSEIIMNVKIYSCRCLLLLLLLWTFSVRNKTSLIE